MTTIIAKTGFDISLAAGYGVTTAIVGWLIVLTVFTLLVIIFTQLPKLIYYNTRKKLRAKNRAQVLFLNMVIL